MGAISNLARETELLPAITREQLLVIQSFDPKLTMRDIRKPHDALWEFKCERERPMFSPVYVWMSEEGRVLATAYEEQKLQSPRSQDIPRKTGFGVMVEDWDAWLGGGRNSTIIEDEYGLHSIGESVYDKVQAWAIEQVKNRVYTRGADYYGRVWEGIEEPKYLCPVCGQPKAQPCDHTKIPDEIVSILRNSTTKE